MVAYASEVLGESLTRQDRIDHALAAYRHGLDALLGSPQYRSVRLRNKAAYLLEARLHRIDEARSEALGARLEAEIMAGSVEDRAGNYGAARTRFESALDLVKDIDTHGVERALLYASYGNLLWKQRELGAAQHRLRQALRLDQQRVALHAQTSHHVNLSAVNIMATRYEDARRVGHRRNTWADISHRRAMFQCGRGLLPSQTLRRRAGICAPFAQPGRRGQAAVCPDGSWE